MELLLPLLLVLMLAFMFFNFRKQKKQMSETAEMQNSLTAGTQVMTTTGLYGTVVGLGEDTIDLEIAPGVTTTWLRRAVAKQITPEEFDGQDELDTPGDDVIDHDPATPNTQVEFDKRPEDR